MELSIPTFSKLTFNSRVTQTISSLEIHERMINFHGHPKLDSFIPKNNSNFVTRQSYL